MARHKSLTKAAACLGVSQPAVSQSLKQLEDILKVKLTVRCSHGIKLTEEGQKLYPLVKKGCDAFDKVTCLFENDSLSSGKSVIRDCFISGTQYCHFAGQKLPYRILEHIPVILPPASDSCRVNLNDFLSHIGIKLKPAAEHDSYTAILSDTILNTGIGYMPYDYAKPFIDSGEVYLLTFESDIPPRGN